MGSNVVYENKIKPVEVWTESILKPFPHLHKEVEIIFVAKGEAHILVDHRIETVSDGDLFVCFPNQVHYHEKSDEGLYYLFAITPDICFGMKELLYDNVPKNNVIHLKNDDEIVKVLTDAVSFEGEYGETCRVGLINHALALIIPEFELTPRIKSNDATLQNIVNYCSLNFMHDVTLDGVAASLHMSKYHISHLLNKKLGISLTGYINILRINSACDLLKETDKSIADISEEVGFGSIRTFNRVFASVMKMTPGDYRKKSII